jgi:lysyl-tRNA synthetase class 2
MFLSDQEKIRREKLKKLRNLGIDPYPALEYSINSTVKDIIENFKEKKKIKIAGRLMNIRIMGKSSFANIKDHTGFIQIYINYKDFKDEKKKLYDIVFKKLLDIGDIIGIKGFLFKTKLGEITIHITFFTLLSKSLRPLPQVKKDEKGNIYDSFSNIEQRYRMRYVDLIVNTKVKKMFLKRIKIIKFIRNFLNNFSYLEVDTPILQSIPGGAIAKPFITYHNALNIPLYLRISNELYLKRLIIGGFHGVYEFSRNFRNEGIDRIHNPEFTILELYVAYKDYNWMMNFIENLIKNLVLKLNKKTEIEINNKKINFQKTFPRITILNSIKKYTGFDITNMNKKSLIKICKKLHVEINKKITKENIIEEIFSKKCEKHYINPTFITDFPIEMSPLTKKHRYNKNLTERFELIIDGKEIANSYSELNDPIEQLERFKKQFFLDKKKVKKENLIIDYDFIRALEIGMPPTAGIGIGIDRLIMLLTNQSSIQEILFFPHMKPKNI